MEISPDAIVFYENAPIVINATLAYTWGIMLLLLVVSWLITRKLSTGTTLSPGQNMLEVIVSYSKEQIREVAQDDPEPYLPFVGTLFLFIATANALTILPLYQPPTGSITTTAALAICVFVAVPFFGISKRGLGGYLKSYIQPNPVMLPFNIIGEVSRSLALAVRLFGNIMSGTLIVGVLLSLAPLFFPIVMQAFGLLIGLIQAYIFAILAMVYIASAVRTHHSQEEKAEQKKEEKEKKQKNSNEKPEKESQQNADKPESESEKGS